MKTNLFNFSHGTKGVTPAHPLQAFIGSISVVDTTHRVFLFFSLFLFLSTAPQAWAWKFDYPTVYFYTTSSDSWPTAMLFAYRNQDGGNQGSCGFDMSSIPNTQLWRVETKTNWGDKLKGFKYGILATSGWAWQEGDNWSTRWSYGCEHYSHTGDSQTDLPCATYLMTSSGSSNLSVSTLSGGYSDLNKTQTVKVMISTNGGSSYSEATTTWYSNSVSANRYKLTGAEVATYDPKNLTLAENTVSAVITSSITFTATADDNFTFAGWATDDQGPDDTNASYSYTVSGTQTIYAYFKENTSTITLEGCTASSTTAGPITTGTATAKEPAGKEVTGFQSTCGVTNMSAMANKAVTFNATAAGTVTAQFAYKTPTIEVASKATYTLGGAAIKLNPQYTDLATDATYAWTGTNVIFSDATAANPNISVAAAGEYTITITVTQGDKHSSQNITLTATDFTGDDCGTCFQYTAQ